MALLRFAEFFAGIGLMRLGLERAGWTCKFANDIDPAKHAMYASQFGKDRAFALGDIADVAAESVPIVELATASFPCTDLSLAGARSGLSGTHSSAFWSFTDLLSRMGVRKPPILLLENVIGFVTSKGGSDLESALLALNRLGYAVDAFTLDAGSFVPQSRPRLFIVGALGRQLPQEERSSTRANALRQFRARTSSIRWMSLAMPPLAARESTLESALESISPDDLRWWSRQRVDRLLDQMSPAHKARIEEPSKCGMQFATAFRRVRKGTTRAEIRTDGVAGCLRTPKGGSARQILLAYGNGDVRARLLTPRECARLMGADDYRIDASVQRALFGFGDAVCVPAIEWIARNMLSQLTSRLNEISADAAFEREAV